MRRVREGVHLHLVSPLKTHRNTSGKIISHFITSHHIILHYTVLHYTTLHYITSHFTTTLHTTSHHTTSHHSAPHTSFISQVIYLTIYLIVLSYNSLHCTTLDDVKFPTSDTSRMRVLNITSNWMCKWSCIIIVSFINTICNIYVTFFLFISSSIFLCIFMSMASEGI